MLLDQSQCNSRKRKWHDSSYAAVTAISARQNDDCRLSRRASCVLKFSIPLDVKRPPSSPSSSSHRRHSHRRQEICSRVPDVGTTPSPGPLSAYKTLTSRAPSTEAVKRRVGEPCSRLRAIITCPLKTNCWHTLSPSLHNSLIDSSGPSV